MVIKSIISTQTGRTRGLKTQKIRALISFYLSGSSSSVGQSSVPLFFALLFPTSLSYYLEADSLLTIVEPRERAKIKAYISYF